MKKKFVKNKKWQIEDITCVSVVGSNPTLATKVKLGYEPNFFVAISGYIETE